MRADAVSQVRCYDSPFEWEAEPMSDPATVKPHVIIVGYGQPARGDDGIGWVAARKLGERFSYEPRVKVIAVHQLTAELAERLGTAALVVFIEAAQGQRPGHLSCTFITASRAGAQQPNIGPADLLAIRASRDGRCPQGMVFTVAGEDFGQRDTLTRTVERACERLVDHVYRIVIDELEHAPADDV